MHTNRIVTIAAAATLAASLTMPTSSRAALTFTVATGWDTQARKDAATAAMTAVVARFNAYGDFTRNNDGNIEVLYNSGVATADAYYNGTIRFGGTWPAERVTQHELNHWLGSYPHISQWPSRFNSSGVWTGPKLNAIVKMLDGDDAVIRRSGDHFYSYGLNYDSEVINLNILPANVAVMYAMRQDMGIGRQADAWSATSVKLAKSDSVGTSGFNRFNSWDDGYFAHPNAAYSTGDFLMRTPLHSYTPAAATPSFTFAGESLTLNNTNGINGGLLYKGVGTAGVLTFKNLILNGGTLRHGSGIGDLCRIDGTLTIASASTIVASQGNINLLANVVGTGTLTIPATDAPTEDNRYVRFLSNANTFAGTLNVAGGRFELAAGANFRFAIGADGVANAIAGATARRVLLDGLFELDLSEADPTFGNAWSLVTAANATYGPSFAVTGFSESAPGLWTNGAGYAFAESTGQLTFATVPEPAALLLSTGASIAVFGRRRRA